MKNVLLVINRAKQIPSPTINGIISRIEGCNAKVNVCDYISASEDLSSVDLIVALGGDGTIIEAARSTAGAEIPIFGINYGKIGYMADAESSEAELIESVIRGDCRIESRMTLDISVIREGKAIIKNCNALNDIVLSNGPVPKLVSFDLYCNNELTQKIRSDGIIIATPTGSSAYSMSAGGPVVDPSMSCIIATPICPHSLHIRPVVFNGTSVIEIKNARVRDNNIFISVDGKEITEIRNEDVIRIQKSYISVPLVKVKDQGFLKVLYTKLSEKEG